MASVEPRDRSEPRRRARGRIAPGVLWIAVVAVLLAGVVAMNVAVLRLNLSLDSLSQKRVKLQADNASMSSQLSSAAATARIESLAMVKLGLRPAKAEETTYVNLGR